MNNRGHEDESKVESDGRVWHIAIPNLGVV